ncbi:hypothetical protein ANN_13194 [Periplaneta americana]|uniref:Uncharacterized protein n=1 Tax=Periplaneta americana TaxID=6978 RepID=A0ABQ8TJQ0_PERAM|nr:hypothetical protein ANN_13194 [Periplaneta americana]
MAGLCEGGNEPLSSLKAITGRNRANDGCRNCCCASSGTGWASGSSCSHDDKVIGEKIRMVFENKVLMKMFGAKRDEVPGEWRKLNNAELHALYSYGRKNWPMNSKTRNVTYAGFVVIIRVQSTVYSKLLDYERKAFVLFLFTFYKVETLVFLSIQDFLAPMEPLDIVPVNVEPPPHGDACYETEESDLVNVGDRCYVRTDKLPNPQSGDDDGDDEMMIMMMTMMI